MSYRRFRHGRTHDYFVWSVDPGHTRLTPGRRRAGRSTSRAASGCSAFCLGWECTLKEAVLPPASDDEDVAIFWIRPLGYACAALPVLAIMLSLDAWPRRRLGRHILSGRLPHGP